MPRRTIPKKRIAHVLACFDKAMEAEHQVLPPLRGQTATVLVRRMKRETDTGLVMVLTLWVEQALTDLLRAFFIRDAHVGRWVSGLSGKLDLKIALVRALGIYWPDQRDDADVLKNIRNRFAHRVLTGTFRDGDVAELVDRLHWARQGKGGRRIRRRSVFIHTANRLVMRARIAKRMVAAMHRGEVSLGELRTFFSHPTVVYPQAGEGPPREP